MFWPSPITRALSLTDLCLCLDRSEFFDPHKVKLPVTEADIVDLVLAALKSGHQVRVLGSGHSRNSLSYSRDVIVSLERFKGVVDLDKPAQQVRGAAG